MQEPQVVERIRKDYPFVSLVFGTHNLFRFAELFDRMLEEDGPLVEILEGSDRIVEELPSEKNKCIGGKQHREVYKRVKKEVREWFETQCASLSSYLNMYQSIQEEDW